MSKVEICVHGVGETPLWGGTIAIGANVFPTTVTTLGLIPVPSVTALVTPSTDTWTANYTDNGNGTWTSATPVDNLDGTWTA